MEELKVLMGVTDSVECGRGRWLDFLPAKGIMHEVLGSSLFVVKDRRSRILTGKEKEMEIIKNLLSPGKRYPDDFIELERLIKKQVNS